MSNIFNVSNGDGYDDTVFASGMYRFAHGADLSAFFKPFTTNVNATGVPKYKNAIVTGFIATSSGLNPFGTKTYYEGHVSGPTVPNDLNITIDRGDVRSLGFKTPQTFVGFGHDIFGYPAPNQNVLYSTSGIYNGGTPSGRFYGNSTLYGHQLDPSSYLAGPVDKRWDQHRGVWTSPQSVYSAIVTYATIVSGTTTIASGVAVPDYYFYDYLRYDAVINDGYANSIKVTGLTPCTRRPVINTFKGKPYQSGDVILLVHNQTVAGPRFGIFAPGFEIPETEECVDGSATESIPVGPTPAPPANPEPVTGEELFDYLRGPGLAPEYGGTGQTYYENYDILMGCGDHTLGKWNLRAGTGIAITLSTGIINTSGNITISLASGISFTQNGVNADITQLTGLTTPLTIGQGGTGSSVKNFVDLQTTQNVSGVKTFENGIRLRPGSPASPSLSFTSGTDCGWSFITGSIDGMAASHNGQIVQRFMDSGVVFSKSLIIGNSATGNCAPAVFKNHTNLDMGASTNNWESVASSGNYLLAWMTNSGDLSTRSISLGAPTGTKLYFGYQGGIDGRAIWPTGFGVSGYTIVSDGTGNLHYTSLAAGSYTDEQAQDAVGNILSNSPTIQFSYNDATPTISAIVNPTGIALDSCSGILSLTKGGTGQVTAAAALSGLLPTQIGQSGNIFRTNGVASSWTNYPYGSSTTLNIPSGITNLPYDPNMSQFRIRPLNTGYIIEGISSGVPGTRIALYNAGSTGISIRHLSSTCVASNQISIPIETRATLRPKDSWDMIYDGVDSQWKVLGGLEPYLRDMRYCSLYFDDWVDTSTVPSFSAGGGSVTSAQVQFNTTANGVIKLNAQTSGSYGGMRAGSAVCVDTPMIFECWVAQETLSNGTDNASLFVGLANNSTTTYLPTNSIGFVYHFPATGSWMWRQSNTSVVTSGNTNITPTSASATRFNHLKFIVDYISTSSGMVKYYIDNNLVGSGTTNIPAANSYLCWHTINVKTKGSGGFMTAVIDAVRFDKYGEFTRF